MRWPDLRGLFGKDDRPAPTADRTDGAALFADDLAAKGTLTDGEMPLEAQLLRLRGQLPSVFVAMLAVHGFGQYADRRFQFCDPQVFGCLIDRLFRGDPDFDPAVCHLVGYSAFGEAVLWTGPHFAATLDFNTMQLSCSQLAPPDLGLPADLPERAPSVDPDVRVRALLPFEPDAIDFWDAFGDPVFARAVATFGPLGAGEVFAFTPPLAARAGVIPRHPLERIGRAPAERAFAAALVLPRSCWCARCAARPKSCAASARCNARRNMEW